jgi:hypothetical protein
MTLGENEDALGYANPDATPLPVIEKEHCKELLDHYLDMERPGLKKLFHPEITDNHISNAHKMANALLNDQDLKCPSREAALYLSLLTLYDLVIFVGKYYSYPLCIVC